MNYKVSDGQNYVDIALEQYGRAESIVDLMLNNNLSLVDELTNGQILSIDSSLVKKAEIVNYYINRSKVVNTGKYVEIGNNQFLLQSGAGLLFQSGSKFIFQ